MLPKLHFNFFHIGDQIIITSIPENYFNATGDKVIIDDERIWSLKYNPYVIFKKPEEVVAHPVLDLVPDCRIPSQAKNYASVTNSLIASSQAEYMCLSLGLKRTTLRHPRLYIYEDETIIPNKIVVHTTGSDRTRDKEVAIRTYAGEDALRIMSDEVIDVILKNYKDWQIVQVGGKEDKPLGGHSIDRRGQYDYWQTAKEIATSSRFIGVSSGPWHIANCYPRVDKRIVFMEFPESTLLTYKPGDVRNFLFSWFDPTSTFFNRFQCDVGLTYAYSKI